VSEGILGSLPQLATERLNRNIIAAIDKIRIWAILAKNEERERLKH
jgi:hypothetical protein